MWLDSCMMQLRIQRDTPKLNTVVSKKSLLQDINFYFSKKIVKAIIAITKRNGEDYFEDYLNRVVSNKIALAVKTADAKHNLVRTRYIENKITRKILGDKYLKASRYLSRMNART